MKKNMGLKMINSLSKLKTSQDIYSATAPKIWCSIDVAGCEYTCTAVSTRVDIVYDGDHQAKASNATEEDKEG